MRRRDFLTTTAAAAAIVAVCPTANAATVLPTLPITGFNRTQFRSWIDDEFRLSGPGSLRAAHATLIAVDDGPECTGIEQFSAVFRGAALPTGLCRLSHADGAQFVLHLHGSLHSNLRRAHFSLLEPQHG
jgi:hypothetical protein